MRSMTVNEMAGIWEARNVYFVGDAKIIESDTTFVRDIHAVSRCLAYKTKSTDLYI